MTTAADLLAATLVRAGAQASFGPVPLAQLRHVRVDEPALAALLADADGRIGPGPGVAWDGSRLRLSSRPGGTAPETVVLDDPRRLTAVLEPATRAVHRATATREIEVTLDLDAPMNPRSRLREPVDYLPFAGDVLPPSLVGATTRVAMLVGPGVVRRGGVDGLRAFAGAAGLAVANTWGAKGVFNWDSPHHMGTCGLQARDFELLGLGDLDVLVTSGLDRDESPPQFLDALAVPRVDVAPEQLGDVAALAEAARPSLSAANALYERLAAVAQPGYVDDRFPLHPARAVAQLGAARPAGGVIAADPGAAGLWVARTLPTTELGSVIVPATRAPGIAAAIALCLRLRGRAAAAVTTAPVDATTEALCALAAELGTGFPLFVWGSDAATVDSVAAHEVVAARIGAATSQRAVERIAVPVDWSCTDALVDAAGPVVAWPS